MFDGLRIGVICRFIGANPGGSDFVFVNFCNFNGRESIVRGLEFDRVKKFSFLSLSLRSVFDKNIVIFDLFRLQLLLVVYS